MAADGLLNGGYGYGAVREADDERHQPSLAALCRECMYAVHVKSNRRCHCLRVVVLMLCSLEISRRLHQATSNLTIMNQLSSFRMRRYLNATSIVYLGQHKQRPYDNCWFGQPPTREHLMVRSLVSHPIPTPTQATREVRILLCWPSPCLSFFEPVYSSKFHHTPPCAVIRRQSANRRRERHAAVQDSALQARLGPISLHPQFCAVSEVRLHRRGCSTRVFDEGVRSHSANRTIRDLDCAAIQSARVLVCGSARAVRSPRTPTPAQTTASTTASSADGSRAPRVA